MAFLARTYGLGRPPQPEKRLSQENGFSQGVNLPFFRLQRARAARCVPWA
jgi:hypothetical protein